MEFLVYVNAIFSVFVEGTYPVRPVLCIVFLFLLAGTLFVARKGIVLPHRFLRPVKLAIVVSLVTLFLGNLAAQSIIFYQHDIPQTEPTFFIDSGGVTGTRLTHDHVGKAMVGASVGNLFSSADTGASVLSFLPAWVAPLESSFFIIALLGSIAIFPLLVSPFGKGKRYTFLALYGLTVFIVLVKSIDGGLLSDAAFLAFVTYIAILFGAPHAFLRRFWYGVIAYAWVVAIFYELGAYRLTSYLFDSAEKALLYGLVALAVSLLVRGMRRVGWILLAAAIILIVVKAYPELNSWHSYITSRIDPDKTYAVSVAPLSGLESVGSLGGITWYDLHSAAGVSVGEFVVAHGLPLWWRPVAYRGTSCRSPGYFDTVRFTLLVPTPVSSTSFSMKGIAELGLLPAGEDRSGWKRYEGSIVLNPCVPEPNEAIEELILATGAKQAIIFRRDIRRESFR